ncbi:homoserine dehydrogenase [Luteimonas sp. BDR2-5]|uniref:homoserine dehydrogenase n=1 Tax=Proluteimonas luteida TaxID=2878685 RepID=UPI001E3EFC0B|nr:homoserine dehydrogenase [Luteimonas sp. BDR2-5]MCD9027534.1 homoserine dehydrogenase [Luteimonas sp. BDR2-5]
MSSVVPLRRAAQPQARTARLALLGTGTVGSAFVARYGTLAAQGIALPGVSWICNSRTQLAGGDDLDAVLRQARAAAARRSGFPPWAEGESPRPGDIVVDATASETVADWHPEWLARGIHVVTANKLGTGGDLGRAQAIGDAGEAGGRYGDSATVGAGLPLLRSLRALVDGGDRIHSIEGVLSGSLAWLFAGYDGSRPFSACVREAQAAGYTEPDPRVDLSGEDVRRKLLILARTAGFALSTHEVEVESLVDAALAQAAPDAVDGLLDTLDAPLEARRAAAAVTGRRLCFVGRFDAQSGASVGLQALPPAHPLCAGGGTDNRVAIHSDRYRERPLVIQGPGAGADITAAALLDDVLRIARG